MAERIGDLHDVIVVGAGVVGALIACRLREAGRDVLILDAGGTLPGRDRLVENHVLTARRSPGGPYRAEADPRAPSMESDSSDVIQPPGPPFKSTYERMVGGTTWHWFGLTPRMIPSDFRLRTLYGRGVNWPIDYADLEPWYCEAERELGVSGDHAEQDGLLGGFRSREYPMTPVFSSYSDELVRSRIDALTFEGIPLRLVNTPQARNSRPYQGRPACAGNSSCIPICPIGAKYDATVHIERFARVERGRGELRERTVVTRIAAAEDGSISHLEATPPDGNPVELHARLYVVAAHAIETPRLLLLSGLCRGNTHVGAYLMDHFNRALVTTTDEQTFPFRGPPTTSGIDALRDGPFRRLSAAFRVSLGNDGGGRTFDNARIIRQALSEGRYGADLRDTVRQRATRLIRAACLIEVLPDPANRVSLATDKDPLGLPKARIDFHVGDYEQAGLDRADKFLKTLLDGIAPGGSQTAQASAYDGAGHILGTTRMGATSSDSVVDSFGRVHGHSNLFIAGCSTFPTSGTCNPTLTAAALSLRLADLLITELTPAEVRS